MKTLQPVTKITASEVPWMGYFRTSEHGQILSKTALQKGEKIGAYNPFGQLIWIDKTQHIIIVDSNA